MRLDTLPLSPWFRVALWTAVASAITAPEWMTGRSPYLDDVTHQYLPWFTYAAEHLGQGEVPLWNPYVYGGMPFHTNPEAATFCPLHVVFILFPFPVAVTLLRWLQVLVAGLFMDLFLGRLGLRGRARFLGALSLVLSGYFTWQATQIPYLDTLCWFPAVLLAFERWMDQPTGRRVAALSVAWTVQMFGGSPEIFLYSNLFLALWGAGRLAAALKEWSAEEAVMRLAWLGAAVGLAVMAMALQWLPTVEFIELSNRATVTTSLEALKADVPASSVYLTFLAPWLVYRMGAPFPYEFLMDHVALVSGYLCTITVVLAWVGALTSPTAGRAVGLLAISVVALVLSHAPLNPWLSGLFTVIPFRWFRWPHNFLLVHVIATSMLAALGLQALLDAPRRRVPVLTGVLAVMLGVAWWGTGERAEGVLALQVAGLTLLLLIRRGEGGARWPATLFFPLVCLLAADRLLFAADALPVADTQHFRFSGRKDLLRFFADSAGPHRVFTPDQTHMDITSGFAHPLLSDNVKLEMPVGSRARELDQEWRWRLRGFHWATHRRIGRGLRKREASAKGYPVNYAMVARYQELGGYDVFRLRRFDEYMAAVPLTRLLAEMDVKYVVSGGGLAHPAFKEVERQPGWAVYENTGPRVRSFLQCSFEELDKEEQVLQALAEPQRDPAGPVLVEGRLPEPIRRVLRAFRGPAGKATLVEHGEERVVFKVDVRRPCLLVLNDVHYPGWKARSQHGPTPLIRVNHLFRAVLVMPYMQQVELVFEPDSWRWAVGVSGLAWILLGLLALVSWSHQRRGVRSSRPAGVDGLDSGIQGPPASWPA